MALPVTITGIDVTLSQVGPYKSSAGNYYFFGKDGTTATTLQAYKATDPSSAWSSIITKTGYATAIKSLSGFQERYYDKNLLTYSETLQNGAWQNKTGLTSVTDNGDGTTTLIEDSSTGTHYISHSNNAKINRTLPLTAVIKAKRGSGTRNLYMWLGQAGGTNGVDVDFDLGAGTVSVNATSYGSGYTAVDATISTTDGDGFRTCTLTVVSNSDTSFEYGFQFLSGTTESYAGDGSSSLIIKETHVNYTTITTRPYIATPSDQLFSSTPIYGDLVFLLIGDGNTTANYKIAVFNMATETFLTPGIAETLASGLATNGQTGSLQVAASVVVRGSGEITVMCNGAQTKKSGTNYARCYQTWWPGGSNNWQAFGLLENENATDSKFPEAVMGNVNDNGLSGRVHFLQLLNAGSEWTHRSASGTTALDTLQTITNSGRMTAAPQGISYDSSGTTKIVVASALDTPIGRCYYCDSGATPTVSYSTVDSTATIMRMFNNGTDAYCLYRSSTDSDLYVRKSTDHGATWEAANSAVTGTIADGAANISIDGNVYQRGLNKILPYIYNDNGTLKYNEFVVQAFRKRVMAIT